MPDLQPAYSLDVIKEALTKGTRLPELAKTNAEVATEIAAQTMGATTLDELLAADADPIPSKEVFGHELEVRAVTWRNGDEFEGQGPGIYVILDVLDHTTGSFEKVTAGSTDALRKVFKLVELDALPFVVRFDKATEKTAAGFYPVNCKLIGKPEAVVEEPF